MKDRTIKGSLPAADVALAAMSWRCTLMRMRKFFYARVVFWKTRAAAVVMSRSNRDQMDMERVCRRLVNIFNSGCFLR